MYKIILSWFTLLLFLSTAFNFFLSDWLVKYVLRILVSLGSFNRLHHNKKVLRYPESNMTAKVA